MKTQPGLVLVVVAASLLGVQPVAAECKFDQSFGNTLRGGGKGDTFTRGSDKVKVKDRKDGKLVLVNPYNEEKTFTQDEFSKLVGNCTLLGQFPEWGKQLKPNNLSEEFAGQSAPVAIVTAAQGLDVADLNGDGRDDLVQINARHTVVTVVMGAAGGGFERTRTEISTGSTNETLALGDLNGDGAPDLVVARPGAFTPQDTGSLTVMLGARNGSFGAPRNFPAGVAPQSVALADFNGDGRLDAAVANGGSFGAPNLPADVGSLSILLGDGAGGFGAAKTTPVGSGPRSVLAYHANFDGKLDLAVANRDDGTISVLLGGGDGTFQGPKVFHVGVKPSFLGSADFNGDGRPDLAVLHPSSSTISLWWGDAVGAYRAHGRYLCGSNIDSFDIMQPGSDARPTIISPDATGSSYMILVADNDGSLVAPASYTVGVSPSSAAAGDFDGDGAMDLAVGSSKQAAVLFNPKPFDSNQQAPRMVGSSTVPAVAVGDFNGDGRADLATGEGSSLVVSEGRADKTLAALTPLNAGGQIKQLRILDANGDGRLDVVAVKASSAAVFLGGAAGLGARADFNTIPNSNAAAAGDFNGDGRADLAVVSETQVAVLTATAAGGFGPARPLAQAGALKAAAAEDFNGDGRLDLVAAGLVDPSDFTFGLLLFLGDGQGGFGVPSVIETEFGPSDLSAHDFNRDGYMDLFIAHCCGDTNVSYLQGRGDGSFSIRPVTGGASPIALAAADFDGDGDLDLAVVGNGDGRSEGSVSILANNIRPADHALATGGLPGSLAPDSIVSAYGAGLSAGIAAAETPQWPEALGGVRVSIRDSEGAERAAGIAFASPGQVNYHLPAGLAEGQAEATIQTADGRTLRSPIFIERVAPGLFVADATRLAAAWAIRVKPSGDQILEPVVELAPNGAPQGAAIDLSVDGDIMVLQLFGTGIRGAAAGSVTATIDGAAATVLYAGPQNQFPGLDQINIQIPRSLAGRGVVDVVIAVEGSAVEAVRIRLR